MTDRAPDERGAASVGLMFRLAVLVVGMGVISLSLLSYRQLRLQAIHEQSDARLRQAEQDKELWHMRSEISLRITPEQVGILGSPSVGVSDDQ